MKLIVTGATGLVGTEVIRLALRNPTITSVIALARKNVPVPANSGDESNAAKLTSVVLEEWTGDYPESVTEQLRGSDACIWCLAVTPTQSRKMEFAEVTKICLDYTTNALSKMAAVAHKPFRFIYTSGMVTERDQSKSLTFMSDYRLMRGRVENEILQFADQHAPDVQVTVTQPGSIDGPGRGSLVTAALQGMASAIGYSAKIHVSELAAAMLDQCLNGITKDPLTNKDCEEIGQRILKKEDYAV